MAEDPISSKVIIVDVEPRKIGIIGHHRPGDSMTLLAALTAMGEVATVREMPSHRPRFMGPSPMPKRIEYDVPKHSDPYRTPEMLAERKAKKRKAASRKKKRGF